MSIFGKLFGSRDQRTAVQKVTFVREEKKKINDAFAPGLVTGTYRFYKAGSKDQALEFLNKQDVSQKFLYLSVDTPDGRWCKDCDGVYDGGGH
jgi:hypothetical protein